MEEETPHHQAVPRNLLEFREKSPGDTSPEPPEGTPTRGEGEFQQTRGEGLPMDRSGGPVEEAKPPVEDEIKKRYREQKEAKKLAAEAARRKKKQREIATSPVQVKDFAHYIQEQEQRMLMLNRRIESLLIALSAVGRRCELDRLFDSKQMDGPTVEEASPSMLLANFVQEIKKELPLAGQRWENWRDTVQYIEGGDINLVDMREKMEAWNADPVNPRINRSCFHQNWLLWKFSKENPDATLTLEEKKELAKVLGFSDQEVEILTQGSFPKPVG